MDTDKPIRLLMTLLVRDEVEILEYNIKFHLSQGVDYILVIDNGSVDGTKAILEKYKKKKLLDYFLEKDQTFEQSKWITKLHNFAINKYNPDFIFHCDADEFWLPISGSLKDHLPPNNTIYYIPMVNYLPPENERLKGFSFHNFKYVVDKKIMPPHKQDRLKSSDVFLYGYPRKVILPGTNFTITQGNHDVISSAQFRRINNDGIFIHHFPIYNFVHFKKKVMQGGAALSMGKIKDKRLGWHWREWYSILKRGELSGEYAKLTLANNKSAYLKRKNIRKTSVPKRIMFCKEYYFLHIVKNFLTNPFRYVLSILR